MPNPTLDQMMPALVEPFDPELVKWKPQATSRDKTRGLAVAYVDVRAYQDRLNEVCGSDWSDDYELINNGTVILCRLTVAGVTRCDIGEAAASDQNTATSAIAQAFKRACVKFGLGAYLYRLPKIWAAYDEQRRQFTPTAQAELAAIAGAPTNGSRREYGDGTDVSDNEAELQAFVRYEAAHGAPPESLDALRAWTKNGGGDD